MEYFGVFLLMALTVMCSGQDLKMGIYEDKKQMVKPGGTMNLTCHVNMSLRMILTNYIQWFHMSLVDPKAPVETLLMSEQTLQDGASPQFYGVLLKDNATHIDYTLIIKKVRPQNDGIYKCVVTPHTNSGEAVKTEVHVIVLSEVETLALSFDGEGEINKEVDLEVQREEGKYGVTCIARGFNPNSVTMEMMVGDQVVDADVKVMPDPEASKAAGAPRYSAYATAPDLPLEAGHTGKKLACRAKTDFAGSRPLVVSVPLTVIALEPVIKCNKNVSAAAKDLYVKINCTVTHENVQIESYRWEIGDTGEIIVPGQTSPNYNDVTVKVINPTTTEVTLDLYQVDEWHFNTYYYLDVFTKNGGSFRTSADLIRREEEASAASQTTATLLLCALGILFAVFRL